MQEDSLDFDGLTLTNPSITNAFNPGVSTISISNWPGVSTIGNWTTAHQRNSGAVIFEPVHWCSTAARGTIVFGNEDLFLIDLRVLALKTSYLEKELLKFSTDPCFIASAKHPLSRAFHYSTMVGLASFLPRPLAELCYDYAGCCEAYASE